MAQGSAEHPPGTWHPVRLLPQRSSRQRGMPVARDPQAMIAWCEGQARHGWKAVLEPDFTPVFWFEDNDDALRFTLRFFPFGCG